MLISFPVIGSSSFFSATSTGITGTEKSESIESCIDSGGQCSDVKAAGQRALNIPGGKGVGCHAGGLKDCCYCVYNMTRCEKAFGRGPCQATYDARKKQGFDGLIGMVRSVWAKTDGLRHAVVC